MPDLPASPVNVDSEGMQPAMLECALQKGARAVILTPRAHNPTGCSLSASRAAQLQEILARYPQTLVIVDDHFALLSACRWYPVIAQETVHWAIVRSMSKTLGPDFTPGYRSQRSRHIRETAFTAQLPAVSGSAICCRI